MKIKKLLIAVFASLLAFPSFADEGMWMLPLLKQQKFPQMKEMGLQMAADDIYNLSGTSLKDAVVQFGSGCTAEIISPEGLILTNHHCGYGAIQNHSSIENNYLEDGFWAMSKAEELPNEKLSVTFVEKIEDVTHIVQKALIKDIEKDIDKSFYLSSDYLNALAKTIAGEENLKNNIGTEVEIKAFFDGNKYYMFTKKRYSDVRLVGAPPSSIGKFGADTDNWMWPRHAGDFALFRIYTDKNGNPAQYSAENIPLKPKRWLKISTQGVQENDFAMILGFPARTNKFYTSWEVAERRNIDNNIRIRMRNIRQQALLQEMLADPKVNIQYASKYSSSTNGYKNAIGSNWAIKNRKMEEKKRAFEADLVEWARRLRKPAYIKAMDDIRLMVEARANLRYRSQMLDEGIVRAIEFNKVPTDVDKLSKALTKGDKKEIAKELSAFDEKYKNFVNKDYSRLVDAKVAKIMLKEYTSVVKASERPDYFSLIESKFGGDIDAFVDYLFENSIYTNPEKMKKFIARPEARLLNNDPMILFALSTKKEENRLKKELKGFDKSFNSARKIFLAGILEKEGELSYAPDANRTLRLSYGQVKGYIPRNAVSYGYQTTLEGVMEKEDAENWEFVVSDKLKDLYKSKDYGAYGTATAEMPVNFAASTHTTGGNSGSPVMNGAGELIGINFDRNWEGVGGDIEYLPEYQRSIIVDIRYVLFVIDKFAGATHLIDEMDLK